jgi:hypothetical protein
MKREVDTIEEAEAIVNPLLAENKWAVTVAQTKDNKFIVQWSEHKMYTAQDGKEYHDEVWTTKEGEMKFIQDIDPEHARNILRMIIRQDREDKKALDEMYQQVIERLTVGVDDEEVDDLLDDSFLGNPGNRGTLH